MYVLPVENGKLGAISHIQLFENHRDIVSYRTLRDAEAIGNLLI
jgi:hypothetical protein